MDSKFRFGLIKRSNDEAVPEAEPIFILRGRDLLSVETIRHYQQRCREAGLSSETVTDLDYVCSDFLDWQARHPSDVKHPGVTQGYSHAAYRIVESLLDDLTERRGLRHEWERIEPDIQGEIRREWMRRVEEVTRGR